MLKENSDIPGPRWKSKDEVSSVTGQRDVHKENSAEMDCGFYFFSQGQALNLSICL